MKVTCRFVVLMISTCFSFVLNLGTGGGAVGRVGGVARVCHQGIRGAGLRPARAARRRFTHSRRRRRPPAAAAAAAVAECVLAAAVTVLCVVLYVAAAAGAALSAVKTAETVETSGRRV